MKAMQFTEAKQHAKKYKCSMRTLLKAEDENYIFFEVLSNWTYFYQIVNGEIIPLETSEVKEIMPDFFNQNFIPA